MKKLINICGTGRSGSTMVDLMLGNDPRAFSLGEIHAWFRPFRTHHFKIICSCGKNNCPWQRLKNFSEKDFYQKCFEELQVDILVDSSKNPAWVIDNNLREGLNGTEVINILLYKDPVSYYYSCWKRGGIIQNAKFSYKRYYKRFFRSRLPFLSLNYNKLVSNPSETLKKLCNAIDIYYFEGKERFWEKEHHHVFGSMGTRKQVEKAQSEVRKKESYPLEFQKMIPEICKIDERDKDLQWILSALQTNELHIKDPGVKIRKPYWYYASKMKQKYRQRFPQSWKYDQ